MKKFKTILNNDELNNVVTVKEYLEFSFRKRKPEKNYKLYINICNIYNLYPNTIIDILDNIPKLGYYKDYFHILKFSKNDSLNNYIYNLVVKQLKLDMENIDKKKEISTLGKWLPREKSKINKNCGFVDKFNKLFFPDIIDENAARRKYRLMKTKINNILGTLESKYKTKKYDEIDYNKVSPYALKINKKLLMNNEHCKLGLDKHETDILKKSSLSELTKEITICNKDEQKIIDIWDNASYHMKIPYIRNFINNSVCIIDLSKDTYNVNTEFFTLGMALLVNKHSVIENNVMIDNNFVKLHGDIITKNKQLLRNIGPCNNINIENILEKQIDQVKCLIFVTTKEIKNIELLKEKNILFIQFIPHYDKYDMIYYNGDKIRKFQNHLHMTPKKENEKISIKEITDESRELRDKTFIYKIIVFMLSIKIICMAISYFV